MATYAGPYRNPTEEWTVEHDEERGDYYIGIVEYCRCGSPCCSRPVTGTRPHTNGLRFEEFDMASDYIEQMHERYEEDYDQYLEENRHAIVQSERYEMWRNEQ